LEIPIWSLKATNLIAAGETRRQPETTASSLTGTHQSARLFDAFSVASRVLAVRRVAPAAYPALLNLSLSATLRNFQTASKTKFGEYL